MRKIRRRCKCGCGEITNYGKMYIRGHHFRGKKLSVEHIRKLSEAHRNMSDETRKNMSLAQQGNRHSKEIKEKMSLARNGKNMSDEAKLNNSLSKIKHNPNYPYCEVWHDKEYINDIRKDHCENKDCKKICERLCNHHIYLDKKKCKPIDIMTMCASCHAILHHKLQRGKKSPVNPKDFIIINRPDHVSYIHKKSREIIKLRRLICQSIQ